MHDYKVHCSVSTSTSSFFNLCTYINLFAPRHLSTSYTFISTFIFLFIIPSLTFFLLIINDECCPVKQFKVSSLLLSPLMLFILLN